MIDSNNCQPENNEPISNEPENDEPIHFRDIAPGIELACWTVLLLAPMLRWINGPAVTNDQFVVQVTLVSMALAGAVGLRIAHWVS